MNLRKFSQIIWLFYIFTAPCWAQQVEVKNNFFYVDGEKYFVKGIGYEVGALPGKLPWEKTYNPEQLQFDIQRIVAAGFNTIRTWAPFTAEELNLLQSYDIKIIMGIWIDPHADFSDPIFINQAKNLVTSILNYSRNYDNIIAYLIMNEPLPETIFEAGYNESVQLWKDLMDIIHTLHPERPVSIANTSNGTYIDADIFDFSAYNVYIYNPVTVSYLHGYRDFIDYLKQLNKAGHPLVITEYGLSVSPSGPGNWDYGGNSLMEQQAGILHMYKSLVDGGASGSCVFNYSDGWWKSGNEFVHDDEVEEWFGLIGYTSLEDTRGELRPVWEAIKNYQSAIITQPQSSEIYQRKVPVEVFKNETIDRIDILLDSKLIYQTNTSNQFHTDSLDFDTVEMKDAVLVFNCYNKDNVLIKSEEKNILITGKAFSLPTIEITTNDDFWSSGVVDVEYNINKSEDFETDSQLDYIFYPHIGFSPGEKYQTAMPVGERVLLSDQHSIDSSVDVFTLGAAFNISYHTFQKRIVNQLTFSRDPYISSINNNELSPILIFPNPSSGYFYVSCKTTPPLPYFNYALYNNAGVLMCREDRVRWNQAVNIGSLKPGAYHIQIYMSNRISPYYKKMIVL